MHTCHKCGKEFKRKYNLTVHLQRKNACDEKNQCKICGKIFPAKWKYIRHMNRKNQCKPKSHSISQKQEGNNNMINNITNSNVVINNFTEIKNFTCEDKSMLTEEYIRSLLKYPYNAPVRVFKYMNLNPEFPQNHNVLIPNKKLPYAKVRTKEGWKSKHINEVNWDIMNNVEYLMDKEYSERCEEMDPSDREKVEKILQELNLYVDYNEVRESAKKWENDIICAINDSKSMLLATKKLIDHAEKFKKKCETQAKWEDRVMEIESSGETSYEEYEKLFNKTITKNIKNL